MLVLPALNEKLGTPNPGKREGCPILSNFSGGGRERLIVEAHRYGGLAPSTGKPTTSMSFGRVASAGVKSSVVGLKPM